MPRISIKNLRREKKKGKDEEGKFHQGIKEQTPKKEL